MNIDLFQKMDSWTFLAKLRVWRAHLVNPLTTKQRFLWQRQALSQCGLSNIVDKECFCIHIWSVASVVMAEVGQLIRVKLWNPWQKSGMDEWTECIPLFWWCGLVVKAQDLGGRIERLLVGILVRAVTLSSLPFCLGVKGSLCLVLWTRRNIEVLFLTVLHTFFYSKPRPWRETTALTKFCRNFTYIWN